MFFGLHFNEKDLGQGVYYFTGAPGTAAAVAAQPLENVWEETTGVAASTHSFIGRWFSGAR